MSSAYALSNFLDSNDIDIALITEHKLLPRSVKFIDSINSNYLSYVNVDQSIDPLSYVRCGKSGTAVLFKKSMQSYVSRIDNVGNERILIVELKYRNVKPYYIFCVYMPACTDLNFYKEILSEVHALFCYYSKIGSVILGDWNAVISSG